MSREIREAIEKISGTHLSDKVNIVVCTVDSINEDEFTCDVTPVSGDATTQIPGVQLNSEKNDGFTIIPKVGSTVIVAYSTRNNPFVLMFSDVEKVLAVQDQWVFNDGSFGGLTKTIELKTQLDKSNAVLDAIKQAFDSWVVVPNDGGAALKTLITPLLAGKQLGTFTDIENKLVKHG